MSDETQANPLFTPFVPPAQPPMAFSEAPAPAKPKRKPRTPKTVLGPLPAKPPKAKRKPRPPKQPVAPEQEPRSLLDLQTILRAADGLKDEDYAAFEALMNTLDKMSKPQGQRVLAALGKVFA